MNNCFVLLVSPLKGKPFVFSKSKNLEDLRSEWRRMKNEFSSGFAFNIINLDTYESIPLEEMKLYLLFMYHGSYPRGGMRDCVFRSENLNEIKRKYQELKGTPTYEEDQRTFELWEFWENHLVYGEKL